MDNRSYNALMLKCMNANRVRIKDEVKKDLNFWYCRLNDANMADWCMAIRDEIEKLKEEVHEERRPEEV